MKFLFRILAVILFIVFFVFALKNSEDVVLRFFLDYELRSPLVLLLLAFFAAGAVLGVLAMTPTVFRYRRELARQKKSTVATEAERQSVARPPSLPSNGIVNR